ncbi:MAG: hypothetical protein AB1896_10665 [Thermodesulfobacteriota bacterium]
MAGKTKDYTRLPGRRRRFAGTNTLWLGWDHLLNVYSSGYVERYKRYYYNDIQAFILRRTISGYIGNAFLLLLVLFCVGLWAWLGRPWLFLLGIAVLFLIILAASLIWGPTCVCHIKTAVQTEKLPSLYRLRTTRKALARIRERVEAAQGRNTAGP